MPKLGVMVGVVGGVAALVAVIVMGLLIPGDEAAAAKSAAIETPAATTITMESSEGAVIWGRLRWLLAGLSISAVVLVSARQIIAAGAPKTYHQPAPGVAPIPDAVDYRAEPAGWLPEASQASIGD